MTLVYLLRHGETAWNAAGNRYCGRTDLPLSDVGLRQAALAARALAEAPLVAVYVSSLRRSRETGEAISALHSTVPIEDTRLLEIDFGAWEGLTVAEIEANDPIGRAAWIHDPASSRAGGTGETGREVSDRMQEALHAIANDHPAAAVAVVGHSTANRLLLAATLGTPLANYRRFALDNSSISLLEMGASVPRLMRFNDVAHLKP